MKKLILIFCMFFIVTELLAQNSDRDKANTTRAFIQDRGGQVYNVKAFGAKGDGTTDDRLAIQKALDSASAHSGTVFVPYGTYRVTVGQYASGDFDSLSCLYIPSNVTLEMTSGTIIKRANSQPDTSYIIMNKLNGDSNIVVRGGILDGNGTNNSVGANKAQYGLAFFYVDNAKISGVTVRDIRGTGSGLVTGDESFSINLSGCSNVVIDNCTIIGKSYTSSGFSINASFNISVSNCIAYECGLANGFTQWKSRNIAYSNCFSYSNYYYGFNNEASCNVTYVNCHAGGITPYASTEKFSADSLIGNNQGFVIYASDTLGIHEYTNCSALYNSGAGLLANDGHHIRINGGNWSYNGTQGLSFLTNCTDIKISGEPYLHMDTVAEIYYGGLYRTWQSIKDSASIWLRSDTNIYYNLGNVSVGTTNTDFLLNLGDGSGLKKVNLSGGVGSAIGGIYQVTDGTSYISLGTTNAIVGGETGSSGNYMQGLGGTFRLGTGDSQDLKFVTGGWASDRLTITSAGLFNFQGNDLTNIDSVYTAKLTLGVPLTDANIASSTTWNAKYGSGSNASLGTIQFNGKATVDSAVVSADTLFFWVGGSKYKAIK